MGYFVYPDRPSIPDLITFEPGDLIWTETERLLHTVHDETADWPLIMPGSTYHAGSSGFAYNLAVVYGKEGALDGYQVLYAGALYAWNTALDAGTGNFELVKGQRLDADTVTMIWARHVDTWTVGQCSTYQRDDEDPRPKLGDATRFRMSYQVPEGLANNAAIMRHVQPGVEILVYSNSDPIRSRLLWARVISVEIASMDPEEGIDVTIQPLVTTVGDVFDNAESVVVQFLGTSPQAAGLYGVQLDQADQLTTWAPIEAGDPPASEWDLQPWQRFHETGVVYESPYDYRRLYLPYGEFSGRLLVIVHGHGGNAWNFDPDAESGGMTEIALGNGDAVMQVQFTDPVNAPGENVYHDGQAPLYMDQFDEAVAWADDLVLYRGFEEIFVAGFSWGGTAAHWQLTRSAHLARVCAGLLVGAVCDHDALYASGGQWPAVFEEGFQDHTTQKAEQAIMGATDAHLLQSVGIPWLLVSGGADDGVPAEDHHVPAVARLQALGLTVHDWIFPDDGHVSVSLRVFGGFSRWWYERFVTRYTQLPTPGRIEEPPANDGWYARSRPATDDNDEQPAVFGRWQALASTSPPPAPGPGGNYITCEQLERHLGGSLDPEVCDLLTATATATVRVVVTEAWWDTDPEAPVPAEIQQVTLHVAADIYRAGTGGGEIQLDYVIGQAAVIGEQTLKRYAALYAPWVARGGLVG